MARADFGMLGGFKLFSIISDKPQHSSLFTQFLCTLVLFHSQCWNAEEFSLHWVIRAIFALVDNTTVNHDKQSITSLSQILFINTSAG